MKERLLLFPTISALTLTISIIFFIPWLAFFALVPLLMALENSDTIQTILKTIVFSLIFSLFISVWMLTSTSQTNEYAQFGFGEIFALIILYTLLTPCIFLIWNKLTNSVFSIKTIIILASLLTISEYIYDSIFNTLPWYSFHFGNPLIGSVYTVQLAEIGGIYILTFFVILINCLITYTIKQQNKLGITSLIVGVFFVTNFLLYNFRSVITTPKVNADLASSGIDPKLKWDDNTIIKFTNYDPAYLAYQLNDPTSTNVESKKQNPTEKSVNFAVIPDQDENTIGSNYETDSKSIFINAGLKEEKKSLPKYDLMLPYEMGRLKITSKGIIGIFNFNGDTNSSITANLVNKGAEFLISINTNDLIKHYYTISQYFFYNRLIAVENRRDIAVKSNMTYLGKTSANGENFILDKSTKTLNTTPDLTNRHEITIYSQYPNVFIYFCELLFIVAVSAFFKNTRKRNLKVKAKAKAKKEKQFQVFDRFMAS